MKIITQTRDASVAIIACLLGALLVPNTGSGQFYQQDGDNCNSTNGQEYLDADAVNDSDPRSVNGSSNLEKFWGGVSGADFTMAVEREAKGNAFFAFYLNTDCDATSGEVAKGGADIALLFDINTGVIQDFNIYEWDANTSDYVASGDTFNGDLGDAVCGDGTTNEEFIEVSFPLSDIFDVCGISSTTPCGTVTVSYVDVHAGGSRSSVIKDDFTVNTAFSTNLPPVSSLTALDTVACTGENLILNGSSSLFGDEGQGTGDSIKSYEWDVDYNGTFSVDHTGESPSITINTNGSSQVALIVTDRFDCKDTAVSTVEVYGRPEASGTLVYTNGVAPVCSVASYDGSASVDNNGANNLVYSWDFGDGNSSSLVLGSHSYVGCNVFNGLFSVLDPDNNSNKCAADTMFFTAALPVELIYFDARLNPASKAVLTWSTASEQNNRGFNILRSVDGINWDEVGFVRGSGNSVEVLSYSWTDATSVQGHTAFYKLKQVDFNGAFTFSESRSVSGVSSLDPVVYPNPAESKLNINLGAVEEGQQVTIHIVNQFGQSVISKTTTGLMEYVLDVNTLTSGIYYAKVNVNGKLHTYKFLKK